MKLSDKLSVPPPVMARQVGDETVLLDLDSGTYFGLDAVGTLVWHLISDGRTLVEVCDAMTDAYEVSREEAERDVLALVESLLERQLVVVA